MLRRRLGPIGKLWCSRGYHFAPWQHFGRTKGKWRECCKLCDRKRAAARRGGYKRRVRGFYRQIPISTGKRRCSFCGKIKSLADFYLQRKKDKTSFQSRCRACMLVSQRPYRAKHSRTSHQKARREAIAAYGGKCACCGESELVFLAIDHIDGKGHSHRRRIHGRKITFWLRKHNYPSGFRILCHCCNWAIHALGTCPHQSTPHGPPP